MSKKLGLIHWNRTTIKGTRNQLQEKGPTEINQLLVICIKTSDLLVVFITKLKKMITKHSKTHGDVFQRWSNLKGTKIWLNDDLIPRWSKLAFTATQLIKGKKLHSTWVRDREVFNWKQSTCKPSCVHKLTPFKHTVTVIIIVTDMVIIFYCVRRRWEKRLSTNTLFRKMTEKG